MGKFFSIVRPSGVSTVPFYSRYTFHFHLRIAAFEGFVMGIFLLNEFVARKTLHASDLEITLMLMIPMVAFALPLFWKPAYQRGKIFLWLGIPGRILLLFIFFVTKSHLFIFLLVASLLVSNLLIPVQNNIIKLNYGKMKGHFFGRAATVSAIVTISTALAFGWFLHGNESVYRIGYPLAGVIGIASFFTWSRIRRRSVQTKQDGNRLNESAWRFADIIDVLKTDGSFRNFLINYFIYGVGFMMLHLVLPLYLVDEMGINYRQAAIARGLIFYTILVFISPLVGRVLDRIGPIRLSSMGFICLALFPVMVLFCTNFYQIYASFVIFGVAMACINMVWNLGPVHLAPPGSERLYMSIHMALVGLRACFAYPLGILIKTVFSFQTVFIVVIVMELIAAVRMHQLRKNGDSLHFS
jgi:MFS family permease